MTRYVLVGLAAGAAIMAVPGVAQANVALDVDCQDPATPKAQVVIEGFVPGRSISGSLLVTLDGQTVHVGSHTFTGPESRLTIRLPRGRGWLVAAFAVGGERWSANTTVACEPLTPPLPPAPPGQPEPPVVDPAPRPPQATEPPTARPIDCAYLRRVGAGRRWIVRLGCVRPQPRITCAELRRRKAGPRWYWRLRCPQPLPPRPPIAHVPVTG